MSDSTSHLPARPSLEQLRKQAKELLRNFRAGDTAAVGRIGAAIPRLTDPAQSDDVILADAQFALAREYGFENWAEIVRHVEAIVSSSRLEEFEQIWLRELGKAGGKHRAAAGRPTFRPSWLKLGPAVLQDRLEGEHARDATAAVR